MDAIKPCGHCGHEAIFFNEFKDAGRVVCTNCGCSTPTASRESAIATWNQRFERTCKVKEGYVDGRERWYECSECGMTVFAIEGESTVFDYSYCPNCGSEVVSE